MHIIAKEFNCPHCNQSLEATVDMLGQNVECPSCNKSIKCPPPSAYPLPSGQLPINQNAKSSSQPSDTGQKPARINVENIYYLVIVFVVGLVFGTLISISKPKTEISPENKITLEDGLMLRDADRMHEIYDQIHRITGNITEINNRYVESISIENKRVSVRLTNTIGVPQRPKVQIQLLNRFGFITDSIVISWIINTIDPGESRIESRTLRMIAGKPVYYTIEFLE